MAAIPGDTTALSGGGAVLRPGRITLERWVPAALLCPALLFLAVFFAVPALGLVSYSVLTQSPEGTVGPPLTFDHYRHFFGTAVYSRVLLTTLQISLVTTCPCRKSNPNVLVIQTTKMRLCEGPTDVLNFAWIRRVFVQRQTRAGLVVICHVG